MNFSNLTLKQVLCSPKKENAFELNMQKLYCSTLPAYIFGAGGGAKQLAEFLRKNRIDVKGFCESRYYYREGREILGKPICLYDDLCMSGEKYNLIIGASGKSIKDVIQSEDELGNEIFVFDTVPPHFDMTFEWVQENLQELEGTFELLNDDLSRETFLSFIDDKAHCISAEVRPLWRLWVNDQYFNDLYDFSKFKYHALIDCGAWIGDTAEEFINFLGEQGLAGKVFAFEPEPDNFKHLQAVSSRLGNIECFNFAVGDAHKEITFNSGISSLSHLSDEDICITSASVPIKAVMVTVDEILSGEKISLIKMDIEGAEERALNGMRKIIADNSPMFAICVYHKIDDLIRIPDCIRELTACTGKNYKFYLRHHASTKYETVLYAVPD